MGLQVDMCMLRLYDLKITTIICAYICMTLSIGIGFVFTNALVVVFHLLL